MFSLGPVELSVILVSFMIFFGTAKLGDAGGSLREGIRLVRVNVNFDAPKKQDDYPAA